MHKPNLVNRPVDDRRGLLLAERQVMLNYSPFAQSISNFRNFKLPVERTTQPQSLQDLLLQV